MDLVKMSLNTVLVLLCGLSLCFAADKTLKCYKCNSVSKDDPCIDAKLDNNTDVETCTGPNAACVKIFSHVYGIVDGDRDWAVNPPVYSRFCAKNHPNQDLGCTGSDGIKGQQVYCLCDEGDFCNSSARPSYLLALFGSLFLAFLLRL